MSADERKKHKQKQKKVWALIAQHQRLHAWQTTSTFHSMHTSNTNTHSIHTSNIDIHIAHTGSVNKSTISCITSRAVVFAQKVCMLLPVQRQQDCQTFMFPTKLGTRVLNNARSLWVSRLFMNIAPRQHRGLVLKLAVVYRRRVGG